MNGTDHGSGRSTRDQLVATYGFSAVDALEALVSYCEEAADLVDRGRGAYDEDVLLRRASEAIFNRIGDTIRNKLPNRLLERYPEQPWQQIVGMRVRMAHIYTDNDKSIMWNTLANDVPRLHAYVSRNILGDC